MSTITIFLPINTKTTVKEGDTVVFGQSLTTDDVTSAIVYDLGKLFLVKPQEAAGLALKREGEEVEKGEVLAKKQSLLSTKMLKALFAGKVARIDKELGLLEIAADNVEKTSIVSPVAGRILQVSKEEIVIDFRGTALYVKQGIGRMKRGLLAIVSKEDEEVPLSHIDYKHEKKVLLGGHFKRPVLEKAFGLGTASILATAIDEGDFLYFEEKKLFDASLILLSKADFQQVVSFEGKEAVVEGIHKRIIVEV